jgi:glycosyltransferase involved in cell wall biosynthesis
LLNPIFWIGKLLFEIASREAELEEKVICHVSTAHPADDARIYYRECRSLTKLKGFKVVFAASGQLPSSANIKHIQLGKIPRNRILRVLRAQIVCLRLFLTLNADIWHLHDPELLPFAVFLSKLHRKVIWDAHEDYFEQFHKSVNYRSYIPFLFRYPISQSVFKLLESVDKRAFAVVAATPAIASKYSNRNCVVVGNEANLEEFANCNPSFSSRNLLFSGPTTPAQSFLEVVRAVESLPELILTVACREPDQAEWAIAQKILGRRLIYLGWLDRKQLAEAMSNSSAGFATYENVATNQTNAPTKFFEFSAAGLPVIATPTLANIGWIAQSNAGLLSSDFSANGIRAALLSLTNSEEKWETCSASGREWSSAFGSWSNSEKRLLATYNQLNIK